MRTLALWILLMTALNAAAQRRDFMVVSVTVPTAGRIEVRSPSAATIWVTLNRDAYGVVWAASDSCQVPQDARTIASSGVYPISFSAREVQGKNLVCLASSDGAIQASAPLQPQ
jgi:hypothetical protein